MVIFSVIDYSSVIIKVIARISSRAKTTSQQTSSDSEYAQLFADWVYQVPGIVLMVGGSGSLAFIALS